MSASVKGRHLMSSSWPYSSRDQTGSRKLKKMKLFFFRLIPSVRTGFNRAPAIWCQPWCQVIWQQTLACLGKVLLKNSPLCQADSTTNRHAYKDDYHSIHAGQRRSRVPLLTSDVIVHGGISCYCSAAHARRESRARDREKSCHFLSHVLPLFHAHRRERQLLTRHLAVAALRESVTRLNGWFARDTREQHTRGLDHIMHQQSHQHHHDGVGRRRSLLIAL